MAWVNVAAVCPRTRALGPGIRAALWVQGCPFRCAGCIAPSWIPHTPARVAPADEIAAELLADPEVTGLTFSGGEPMQQAAALAEVARSARRMRDVTLICFTGYRLERLRRRVPDTGVAELLDQVDVLIDGLYLASHDNGRGLRGSTNQRVHHLTPRLAGNGFDFENRPRRAEVRVADGETFVVGLPPPGLLDAVDAAIGGVPS